MKKSIIPIVAVLTITVNPLTALAQADSQYPAANFEPKVVFIDEAAAKDRQANTNAASTAKTEFDPNYPAANFEPKVIFSGDAMSSNQQAPATTLAKKPEFDPEHPAAYFEPKVIYP